MAKQKGNKFAGLVSVKSANYENYTTEKKDGQLVFADISTGDNKGKYIFANGIEYQVADGADLSNLQKNVSTLNGSVNKLEGNVTDINSSITTLKGNVTDINSSITSLKGDVTNINSSITSLKGDVTNINSSITTLKGDVTNINSSITTLKGNVTDINSSITSLKNANPIVKAQIGAAVANGTATITLDGSKYDGASFSDTFTLVGDNNYVKIAAGTGNDALTISATTFSIEDAGADASGLATAYGVREYVNGKLTDLEGALVFQGGISSDVNIPANPSKGDTYVATANFNLDDTSIDAGDLLIYGNGEWVVVERNLEGAVTSDEKLTENYLVIGKGGQAVGVSSISVNNISTMQNDVSTLKGNVTDINSSITTLKGNVTDINSSITTLKGNVTDINSSITTLKSDVSTLKNASYVNTIKGDSYVKVNSDVNVAHKGDIALSTKLGDISTATEDASGLATAHDVSAFVNYVLQWTEVSD